MMFDALGEFWTVAISETLTVSFLWHDCVIFIPKIIQCSFMHEKPNVIILKLAFNVKNVVLQHQYQSSPLDPILNQVNPV
jgi:hypothetical protein